MENQLVSMKQRTVWIAALAAIVAPLLGISLGRSARAVAVAQEQNYPVGAVHGTILRDDTSQPIPDVQVTIVARGNVLAQRATAPAAPAPQPPPDAAGRRGGRGGRQGNAGPRAAPPAQPVTMTVITDGAGQFNFDRVPAGPYSIQAQLQGFFGRSVNGGSAQATVTSGGTIEEGKTTEIALTMIPGGTISGRILNALGQPLSDTPVSVLRAVYLNGSVSLQPQAQKTTDDRGEYRLYRLPPGEYYVAATPSPLRGPRGGQSAQEAPVTTIYPGTTDPANAALFTLRGGEEFTGIDIQVRTVRLAKIAGRVLGASGQPSGGGRGAVSITPRGAVTLPDNQMSRSMQIKEDGSFEIQNVLPGAYEVIARLGSNAGWGPQNPPEFSTGHWIIGRTPVDVQEADVDGLIVSVKPGFDVKGIVTLDGRPVSPNIRIGLTPDTRRVADGTYLEVLGTISNYHPPIRSDGTFSFPLLPEGPYRVNVTLGTTPVTAVPAPRGGGGGRRGQAARGESQPPAETPPPRPRENAIAPATPPTVTTIPPTTYIADIRQGGISVYDNGFNPGADPGVSLEIMLGSNPGGVTGTVVGPDQKPFAGAMVVLVPPPDRRQNQALYKTSRSGPDGQYQIANVPPGPYKVFAWRDISNGAFQNPRFIEPFEPRGIGVDVIGGGTTRLELEVLTDGAAR